MFFGGYDPNRHEFDPILQSWMYGGPKTRSFWEERNRLMADAWCEYKKITREEGIAEMWKHQQKKNGEEPEAVFVDADGVEHDIVGMMTRKGKNPSEKEEPESTGEKIVKNDKAFQRLARDLHVVTTRLKLAEDE